MPQQRVSSMPGGRPPAPACLPAPDGPSGPSSVAALVPAHNAAGFIQATLDSLSAQTWPRLEVLVSVDRSDDGTLAICQTHAEHDSRFKVFEQTEHLGWIGNSNFLLQQAQADYALFAFHDDLLAPAHVETLAHVLDSQPAVVLAYSDLELSRRDGKKELCVYDALDGARDRLERARRLLTRKGNWWVPAHGLFRLERARCIGGLKHHGAGEFSSDWPWLTHMSLLGAFQRVPETLCFKFHKPGSLSPNWRFTRDHWNEAAASCMREIWNSELATHEKLALTHPLFKKLSASGLSPRAILRRIRLKLRAFRR